MPGHPAKLRDAVQTARSVRVLPRVAARTAFSAETSACPRARNVARGRTTSADPPRHAQKTACAATTRAGQDVRRTTSRAGAGAYPPARSAAGRTTAQWHIAAGTRTLSVPCRELTRMSPPCAGETLRLAGIVVCPRVGLAVTASFVELGRGARTVGSVRFPTRTARVAMAMGTRRMKTAVPPRVRARVMACRRMMMSRMALVDLQPVRAPLSQRY